MRNLLALSAAAVLVFLGIGWYLGWYKVTSAPGLEGHRQISIDVNTQRITEDVNKGKEKLRDALKGDKDQATGSKRPTLGTPTSLPPGDENVFVLPGNDPVPPAGTPRLPPPK